jgi:hypothetical protein
MGNGSAGFGDTVAGEVVGMSELASESSTQRSTNVIPGALAEGMA